MVLRFGRVPVWVAPSELVARARAVLGWTDDAVELVAALPARVTGLLDEVDGAAVSAGRVIGGATTVERLVGAADQVLAEVGTWRPAPRRCWSGWTPWPGAQPGWSSGPRGWPASDRRPVHGRGRRGGGRPASRADRGAVAAGGGDGSRRRLRRHGGGVAERAGRLVDEAATVSGTASRLLALYAPMAERAAPLAGRFVEEFSADELQAAIRMIDQLPSSPTTSRPTSCPILATLDRVGPDVHQLLEVLQDVRLAIQGVPGFRMLRRRGEREEADDD